MGIFTLGSAKRLSSPLPRKSDGVPIPSRAESAINGRQERYRRFQSAAGRNPAVRGGHPGLAQRSNGRPMACSLLPCQSTLFEIFAGARDHELSVLYAS
jgi:hypothetical protein